MNLKEFKTRCEDARANLIETCGSYGVCGMLYEYIGCDLDDKQIFLPQRIFEKWYRKRAMKSINHSSKQNNTYWLRGYNEPVATSLKRRLHYFDLFVNRCIRTKIYKEWRLKK